MKNIRLSFWLLIAGLSVLWLLADTLLPSPFNYFSFRNVFVQYTGVIAMALMSVAMLLSIRPKWIERPLKGLDKMYRLHKWLGVTGLIFSVIHWWMALGTKLMVGWGWLSPPERRPPSGETLSQLQQWLGSLRESAEPLGGLAFFASVILIVLALIKYFPYYWFRKTHKLLAIAYLALVYHSVVLLKFGYWSQPIGWVMAILLVSGTISAVLVLAGRVGRPRRTQGVITSLKTYPGARMIEGSIALKNGWPGHAPGQFAFVTSKKSEGAHPYTIASAWNPEERSLRFLVKKLGDWTNQLEDWLTVDMPVTVEGPYGCFDFNDSCPGQIWIGAGIGITPFIAKMEHLAKNPGQQELHLFHSTREHDQTIIDQLTANAQAANVTLHLVVTSQDGRLTPEKIRASVPEWRSASVWFCGSSAFGASLRKDLLKNGLPAVNYHQELFEMR